MSEQEAGAGSPDSAGTLAYDAAAGSPRSVRTLEYIDGQSDGTLTPLYYPNDHDYGNVDRPWMSTREDRVKFQEIRVMFLMVCGPRAVWKGWNRIKTEPVPARRCKCCGQRIQKKAGESSYVLTDHEYTTVDNVLSRAFAEMNAVVEETTQRHLSNAYRILTDNEAVLEKGLKVVLFSRVQNIVRAIHALFRQTVPESDVQIR
jgi:hypothetical protein